MLTKSKGLILSVFLMMSLSACLPSSERSQMKARKELAELKQNYSVEDFLEAARQNDALAIKLFLDAGMDVNAEDTNHSTALTAATARGHVSMMQVLLAKGANTEAETVQKGRTADGQIHEYHYTPLLLAVMQGEDAAATLLLEHNADVNFTNEYGLNALMCASSQDRTNLIKQIAAKTRNVNALSSFDYAAIDLAHNPITKKLLIDAGENPLTQKFINAQIEAFSEKIDEELDLAIQKRDERPLLKLVTDGFEEFEKEGFSPDLLETIRKLTLKKILDQMYARNMTTRQSKPTDLDRAEDAFDKSLYQKVSAQMDAFLNGPIFPKSSLPFPAAAITNLPLKQVLK